MPPTLNGQRVLVMGLGRFGGGVGVTQWLATQGATVLVTDPADSGSLADSIAQIQPLIAAGQVELRLGEHRLSDFQTADLIIANPAVKQPWDDPYLSAARDSGVAVTTEIRLLIEQLGAARTIGVTGSAGKSTTASMIHHVLNGLGLRTHLGGNIGGSLLSRTARIQPQDIVVLELSSAMLYWLGQGVGHADARGWSPGVAVFTNLSPNHIDWHGSFEHYAASKENIVRYQSPDDVVIRGDSVDELEDDVSLGVLGRHNRHNAAIAIAAARAVHSFDDSDMLEVLRTFHPLPHRLQPVAEFGGMTFVNDSKSTTPEATRLAVESFTDSSTVHLIAGGSEKGADLSSIGNLAERLGGLYTIGATGASIAESCGQEDRVIPCETLERAVAAALDRMRSGDILLLSPGCASFDQFSNYEARGEAFAALVRRAMHQRPAAAV